MRIELVNYHRDLLLNRLIASAVLPRPLRWRALRAAGLDVARSSIAPGIFFGSTRVRIGSRTHVNYGCFFDAMDWITVGNDCDIAMQVLLCTSTHEVGPSRRRGGMSKHAPISIGEGTWIGARATILPGVTIGPGCIVAAGAVVTADCDADSLYRGVPARKVGPASLAMMSGLSQGGP